MNPILIVDDELDLLKLVEFNLKQAGFVTISAQTGVSAIAAARERRPSLILLDLMLPDLQGTDVCKILKGDALTAEIPIIMLTAKAEEIDRVVGFELGADDYVVKPFSPRELVLRVKALLKRATAAPPAAPSAADEAPLVYREIEVDSAAHRVMVEGELIDLTALEFRLLRTLMERAGRVQTRDQLLDEVWGVDVVVTPRTVDTHVKRLREKLGDAGEYVETVRGVGYRFARDTD
ncbi:MAG: winged helix-turn-helix domain-containing protein [Myxococcales bacterium]|nr:winged helix-turn-helix domain-containing protein [Myxococcales bacterium]